MSLNHRLLDELEGLAKRAIEEQNTHMDLKALDKINNTTGIDAWVRAKYVRLYFEKKDYYREQQLEKKYDQ